ncbi:MAG: fibrobacter succinogenes major paralogous domain-containing protein [Bacteroidia bacterium]
MKKYFLRFCVLMSIGTQAQIQQNINKPSGMVSNAISGIDSIRFNSAGDEMQVVLQNGQVELHQIIEIDSITFATTPNPLAHSCGADSVHNPALTYGSITDQEGNVYKTIVIGTQEWMAENLKTSVYRNGDAIPLVTDNGQWSNLTSGARCYYTNDDQNDCPYGMLYNWYAVSDARNVCPTGWHIPSEDEWTILIDLMDPNAAGGSQTNTAGGPLKSSGFLYWNDANTGATNASGFSALPGGFRYADGSFDSAQNQYDGIGKIAKWWTSVEFNSIQAKSRYLNFLNGGAYPNTDLKEFGNYIRCIRN